VQDSTAGQQLRTQAAVEYLSLHKVWVDGGCRNHFVEHTAPLGVGLKGEATLNWRAT